MLSFFKPKEPWKPSGGKKYRPVAVYPLSSTYRGRDSLKKASTAYLSKVYSTVGPTGIPNTAYKFLGTSKSYIQFPNKGKLDTRYSTTLVAWIYPVKPGPIFNYQTNGWGSHFWVTNPKQLFVRFVKRKGGFTGAVVANVLEPRKWNYVAAVYNKKTGIASLWKNGRRVASRRVGRFELRTQYDVRMGARTGDGRYFKGRIACMQIYNYALPARRQLAVMFRCTKGKFYIPTQTLLTQN